MDVQVGPTAEGRYAWLRRVPSRGFLRLALSEGARLRGRVTAPEDGDIGLVECRAATLDGFSVAFESRADGTFDVPGLPPGTVTLLARSREGLSGVVRIDVPATDARIELEGRSLRPEDEPVVILDSVRMERVRDSVREGVGGVREAIREAEVARSRGDLATEREFLEVIPFILEQYQGPVEEHLALNGVDIEPSMRRLRELEASDSR